MINGQLTVINGQWVADNELYTVYAGCTVNLRRGVVMSRRFE